MDFEEYVQANYKRLEGQTRELVEDAFKAGQQSKQAEIDLLREMVKKLIDNTVLSIDDELEDQANNLLKGIEK